MTESKKPQGVSPAALLSALSGPRLEAYRLDAHESLRVVLGRYRWNIALGQSFLPPLHLIEVTLRNNLHRVISQHYGMDAWYDREHRVLAQSMQEDVARARSRLVEQQKSVEPGRVVAELGFGFWTGLLGKEYEQRLWPSLLKSAFPHMLKKDRTRAKVALRFRDIRQKLRNRISHHEPICRMSNLAQLYDDLLDAIRWLSPNVLKCSLWGRAFRTSIGEVARPMRSRSTSLRSPHKVKTTSEGEFFASRWPAQPLSASVEKMFVGLPVSRHAARSGSESVHLPVLSVGDIADGRVCPIQQLAGVELQPGNFERFRVREGDVLISCRGTVLKTALVPPETDGAYVSSNLIAIRPKRTTLDPRLLLVTLRAPPWQNLLRARTRSATGLIQLTIRDIEDLRVPLLPLDLQRQLAALCDAEDLAYQSAMTAANARRALVEAFVIRALLDTSRNDNV